MYKTFMIIPLLFFFSPVCATLAPSHAFNLQSAPDSIQLTSPFFANNEKIPGEYTFSQEDFSPPLTWTNIPPATKEFALIVEDPDATTPDPLDHWLLYKIPPTTTALSPRIPHGEKLSNGMLQGTNHFNTIGYTGPTLTRHAGTHHYHFTLYALDRPLSLDPAATVADFREALANHIWPKAHSSAHTPAKRWSKMIHHRVRRDRREYAKIKR